MYELIAEASFDSAHFLTDYEGKCENLHGHRWRVEARIQAAELPTTGEGRGMVCDFAEFKHAVRTVAERFDHMFLLEEGSLSPATVEALEEEGFSLLVLPFRTTAENLAAHIFGILKEDGWNVVSVEVDETPANRAVYRE